MSEVDAEQFVRTLANNVRETATDILNAARAVVLKLDEQPGTTATPYGGSARGDSGGQKSDISSTMGFASYLTSAIGFGGLTSNKERNNTGSLESRSSSTFALDPYHLEFLASIFGDSPLVAEYVAECRLTGHFPNILPSPPKTHQTATSSNYLSSLWSKQNGSKYADQIPTTTLDEEVLYLYKFLAALPSLRIAPVRRNLIEGFQASSPPSVDLSSFHELVAIEFDALHPNVISSWGGVRERLRSMSCRYALKTEDDLINAAKAAQISENGKSGEPDEDLSTVLFPLLTHLHLAGNSLSSISTALTSHIPRCTYLNLSSNALTTVPSALSFLADLSIIDLTGNRITSISDAEDRLRNVEVLLIQSNALENLLGVESLARLKCLDVSENKIWDVYEVGRLAVLMDVSEIWIAENPLTKLPNYRINIFTYFKERALKLLLDGTRPSPSEQKAIQANMTVAALPPSEKPLAGYGKSGSKTRSTTSRDRSVRNEDKKSTTSGRRSVVSGSKEERRRRSSKKSVPAASETASDGFNKSPEIHGMRSTPDHVPISEPSLPASPSVQRRVQRLAELEKAVGATTITDDQLVDSADLIVSRAAKKVGKSEVKKPKNSGKKKKSTPKANAGSIEIPTATVPASESSEPLLPKPNSSVHFPTISPAPLPRMPADGPRALEDKIPSPPLLRTGTDRAYGDATAVSANPVPVNGAVDSNVSPAMPGSGHVPERSELVEDKSRPPLPPPPPLQPAPTVGTHIGNIGPYRRIFQYDNVTAETSSVRSSTSNVRWVLPPDGDVARGPVGPTARPFIQRRTSSGPDVEIGTRQDFHGVIGARTQAPRGEIKAAPLPALWFGDRRAPPGMANHSVNSTDAQKSGSTPPLTPSLILAAPLRSGRVGSASISTRSNGRSADTAPVYTRLAAETASVAGSSMTWASIPAWMVAKQGSAVAQIPSAPTLPFQSLTNALKLHLMLNVLKDRDREKCLSWLTASCAVQLPMSHTFTHTQSRWFQSAERERESWRSPTYMPAQRPCYILLTNSRVYIFEPKFRFPFTGSHNEQAQDTRYDSNIPSLLRLVRCIRLRAIGRVDVGPNRQYFVIRYYVPPPNKSSTTSPTTGIHPMDAGGLGPAADIREQGHWESVNILTRDKSATTAFLDGYNESLASHKNDGTPMDGEMSLDNAANPVNENFDWAVDAMRDHIFVRRGARSFGYPKSWTNETRTISSPSVNGKWYERILRGGRNREPPRAGLGTNSETGHSKMAASLFASTEEDVAVNALDEIDSTLIKTYLLAGLIVIVPPSSQTQQPAISVRSVSLAATKDFIYLFTERHDVWPPLLFPPETKAPSWVNDAILDKSVDRQDDSGMSAAKGLLVDAVGMVSRVVDVGKVAHVLRCERWRTWRWNGTATTGEGGIVQNGYLGVWRKGRRREHSASAREWGWCSEGECVEGNTAGWSWWLRVVFADPATPVEPAENNAIQDDKSDTAKGRETSSSPHMAMPSRPPTGTDPMRSNERYWDLVFGSLDSANEFLQLIRELRGSKTDGDELSFDDAADDEVLHQRSAATGSSGVEFIIGDD
ncbi:hypothetical protein PhCBS80983_g02700 [Powellomyces hirtus]|uniref:Leucine rich repeat domain-containing protein n=1 Tax=Powellomyces hirtus TaxID=109895 RepID=A0A507E4S0_9FUNG|nr:hypothetical protein PhCBS80983_g02700 [Powellomyces hirtus]